MKLDEDKNIAEQIQERVKHEDLIAWSRTPNNPPFKDEYDRAKYYLSQGRTYRQREGDTKKLLW